MVAPSLDVPQKLLNSQQQEEVQHLQEAQYDRRGSLFATEESIDQTIFTCTSRFCFQCDLQFAKNRLVSREERERQQRYSGFPDISAWGTYYIPFQWQITRTIRTRIWRRIRTMFLHSNSFRKSPSWWRILSTWKILPIINQEGNNTHPINAFEHLQLL